MYVDGAWPPPDPDKIPRRTWMAQATDGFVFNDKNSTIDQQIGAFRKRQQNDFKRFNVDSSEAGRRLPDTQPRHDQHKLLGHEWRDADGERLDDFGVDEEVDFYEDDIPLREIMQRQRGTHTRPD